MHESQAAAVLDICALCAGLLLKPYLGDVSGLKLQPATPFE